MAKVTVIGSVDLPDCTPHVGTLTWTPISTPEVNGTKVVVTQKIDITTDENGQMSHSFHPGYYFVDCVVGGRVPQNPVQRFKVRVPTVSEDSEKRFETIIVDGTVSRAEFFADTPSESGDPGVATVTDYGTVKIDQTDPEPVVVTLKKITGTSGMRWLYRGGRRFGYSQTTELYYESIVISDRGIHMETLDQNGIAFDDLPPA